MKISNGFCFLAGVLLCALMGAGNNTLKVKSIECEMLTIRKDGIDESMFLIPQGVYLWSRNEPFGELKDANGIEFGGKLDIARVEKVVDSVNRELEIRRKLKNSRLLISPNPK